MAIDKKNDGRGSRPLCKTIAMVVAITAAIAGCAAPANQNFYYLENSGQLESADRATKGNASFVSAESISRWLNTATIDLNPSDPYLLRVGYLLDQIRQKGAFVSVSDEISQRRYTGDPLTEQLTAGELLHHICTGMGLTYSTKVVESSASAPNANRAGIFIADEETRYQPTPIGNSQTTSIEQFVMYRSEMLVDLMDRLAESKGYAGAIVDFSSRMTKAYSYINEYQGVISSNGLAGVFSDIQSQLSRAIGPVQFYEAHSANGVVLLLTDREHSPITPLRVFHVEDSTLQTNAMRLAKYMSYDPIKDTADITAWSLDVDYPVIAPYDIIVTSPAQSFAVLFEQYPVQAQLVRSSKKVYFTKRNAPLKEGQL